MSPQAQLLEHLNKKLQDRVFDISESLRTGSAKDFAEYQNLCGVVRGLELAQMESNDLLRRLKEIENDD
jgi:hypothetical protein